LRENLKFKNFITKYKFEIWENFFNIEIEMRIEADPRIMIQVRLRKKSETITHKIWIKKMFGENEGGIIKTR
jgi:hypothetical protein